MHVNKAVYLSIIELFMKISHTVIRIKIIFSKNVVIPFWSLL